MKTLGEMLALAALVAALSPHPAFANGVSDSRVNLPDGPGSLTGIGENLQVDPNMGQMGLTVPVPLPQGYPGMTPDLTLSYNSGMGSSPMGVGWDLPVPFIERTTNRGLPRYTTDDTFAYNGSGRLVHVGDGIYREEVEGSFMRFHWEARGNGQGGYFVAEAPDGRVMYFGADQHGAEVSRARLSDGTRTFRYMLVDVIDVHGHRLHYSYDALQASTPLLSRVEYVFKGDTPRYRVSLDYELRDDRVEDCAPGFCVELSHRLTELVVDTTAGRWGATLLRYEDYRTSGGVSRLASVQQLGREGGSLKSVQTFAYSRGLGAVCDDCTQPFVVDMGKPSGAGDLLAGRASLLDINGDSLPDLLHTAEDGTHTFHLSALSASGQPAFGSESHASALTGPGARTGFVLDRPGVQAFDLDGDGLTDLFDKVGNAVLCNTGEGDWAERGCFDAAGDSGPTWGADDGDGADDPNPKGVRFLDYDNDRRIDIVRTGASDQVSIFHNTAAGFVPLTMADDGLQALGAVFDEDPYLQLADLNGDGLQDVATFIRSGASIQLAYRKNLGYGRWSGDVTSWTRIDLDDITGQLSDAELTLQDINGDGRDDVVAVASNHVHLAVNRGADRFDAFLRVGPDADADIRVEGVPEFNSGDTTVLYADMNANGSEDVVWVKAGQVRFLELFPLRPNLLARAENGIGGIQTVRYETGAEQRARAASEGRPWVRPMSQAVQLVATTDTWVSLTPDLHDVVNYRYFDGFYDRIYKQFRGFAYVRRRVPEAESQEALLTELTYDVGVDRPQGRGLLLASRETADPDGMPRFIEARTFEYGECPLADAESQDADGVQVVFLCQLASERVIAEGKPEAEWVTLRTEQEYDGYGNVVRSAELGVVARGGQACGARCEGDERYSEVEFVPPGASVDHPWLLGLPMHQVQYGSAGGARSEVWTYYDGEPFVGLSPGAVDKGLPTRSEQAVREGERVPLQRSRYDAHGNVVEALGARGSLDEPALHRRFYTMDPDYGLRVVHVDVPVQGADGERYSLVRSISYDPVFNQAIYATGWQLSRDGELGTGPAEQYEYDEFGRLVAIAELGDSLANPTTRYAYELSDPISRTHIFGRKDDGETTHTLLCQDGRGRTVQRIVKLSDGESFADGFVAYNSRGSVLREYGAYTTASHACASEAPDAPYQAHRYDGLGRTLQTILADGADRDGASMVYEEYEPLRTLSYDMEDSDPASSHAQTPTVTDHDGLGRPVRIERFVEPGGEPEVTELAWDDLGRLIAYVDADGNRKEAEYDLLGRTTRIVDPNAGTMVFSHDASGNIIRRVSESGDVVRRDYDVLGRILRQWVEGDEGRTDVRYRYDTADPDCGHKDCTDQAGSITSWHFPMPHGDDGAYFMGYDSAARPTFERARLDGHTFDTRHRFDRQDRTVATEFPDGFVLERTYDNLSRPTSVPGLVDAFEYDERGLLTSVVRGNGTTTEQRFDSLGQVMGIATLRGDELLLEQTLSRDRAGNILSQELSGSTLAQERWALAYDAWYRPVSVDIDRGQLGSEELTYGYDAIDNVRSRVSSLGNASAAHVGELAYGSQRPNAVTSAGALDYAYDAAGRVTERGPHSLSWDGYGRLVAIARDGETLSEIAYDAEERIARYRDGGSTYYLSPEFEVRDGIATIYLRSGLRRLSRIERPDFAAELYSDLAPAGSGGDGVIDAADAWLSHGVSEGLVELTVEPGENELTPSKQLLRSAARRLLVLARAGQGDDTVVTHLHVDQAENIVLATDSEGKPLAHQRFFPNGQVAASSGFVDHYGLSGQERDPDTGLVQFKFRFLDTVAGRWMSPDPAFEQLSAAGAQAFGEGTTAYAYVGNTGLNGVDPHGLANTKKRNKKSRKGSADGADGSHGSAQGGRDRSSSADSSSSAGAATATTQVMVDVGDSAASSSADYSQASKLADATVIRRDMAQQRYAAGILSKKQKRTKRRLLHLQLAPGIISVSANITMSTLPEDSLPQEVAIAANAVSLAGSCVSLVSKGLSDRWLSHPNQRAARNINRAAMAATAVNIGLSSAILAENISGENLGGQKLSTARLVVMGVGMSASGLFMHKRRFNNKWFLKARTALQARRQRPAGTGGP